jgi:aminoglycoside 2'-N-acetyltransferase I
VPEAVALSRVTDLTDAERQAVRALSLAVYPPGESAGWAGRQIEWAAAEWCVRVRISDAHDGLVSYVGISLRDARYDGQPVRVGGIGGVKTHPASRGRGLAAAGIARAREFFREQAGVGFAVLVCGDHLLAYYRRLGWTQFAGTLLVRQQGVPVEFTFNKVMTCGIERAAPEAGAIDLRGPPW